MYYMYTTCNRIPEVGPRTNEQHDSHSKLPVVYSGVLATVEVNSVLRSMDLTTGIMHHVVFVGCGSLSSSIFESFQA